MENKPLDYIIPFTNIKILGQSEAEGLTKQETKQWNVISIWSGLDGEPGARQPDFGDNIKDLCQQKFHDIEKSDGQYIMCSESQLKRMIEFGRQKYDDNLIVHCYAGISRSSATVFSILLDYYNKTNGGDNFGAMDSALNSLVLIKNRNLIFPNRHIIDMAVKFISGGVDDLIENMRYLYNHPIYYKFYNDLPRR